MCEACAGTHWSIHIFAIKVVIISQALYISAQPFLTTFILKSVSRNQHNSDKHRRRFKQTYIVVYAFLFMSFSFKVTGFSLWHDNNIITSLITVNKFTVELNRSINYLFVRGYICPEHFPANKQADASGMSWFYRRHRIWKVRAFELFWNIWNISKSKLFWIFPLMY